eukprot:COSAG02_NODE_774_length_17325_cov_322.794381_6_plen_209_part_00
MYGCSSIACDGATGSGGEGARVRSFGSARVQLWGSTPRPSGMAEAGLTRPTVTGEVGREANSWIYVPASLHCRWRCHRLLVVGRLRPENQIWSSSQYRISATSRTQRPYRTILVVQDACTTETVSFADRVSHSVDRPRAFLHVLRATGSAQIRQSPEQAILCVRSVIFRIVDFSVIIRPRGTFSVKFRPTRRTSCCAWHGRRHTRKGD